MSTQTKDDNITSLQPEGSAALLRAALLRLCHGHGTITSIFMSTYDNQPQPTVNRSNQIHLRSTRPSNPRQFLMTIEPAWVATCVALVYVFHTLGLRLFGSASGFLWLWLVLSLVPVVARLVVSRRSDFTTPFDVSLLLFMLGGLVGLVVSPRCDISLGAFICMLAMCVFYYSWLSHPRLTAILRFVAPLSIIGLLVAFLVVYPQMGTPAQGPGSPANTNHGIGMCLLVAAIVSAAVAIFPNQTRTRMVAGLIAICFLAALFILVYESLPRLIHGDSLEGRLPRWETTVSLLRDSPFTGLGLGCWAFVYHDSMTIVHPTHVHNAYLELYSNSGLLGIAALVVALGIGTKLALQIVRSPGRGQWYGFGIGVVTACLAILIVGILESAPTGVAVPRSTTYFYLVSPVPWVFCGLLVIAHRLITKGTTS